jgi:hypothetical protein
MPRISKLIAALAVGATLALSACQAAASPTPTPIADPGEILTKATAAMAGVKTLHLQLDLSGTVKLDLTGTGSGGPLDLKGTTGAVDLDVASKSLHATVTAPGLLNSGIDAIVTTDAAYYKVTGGLSQGTKYTKIAFPASVSGPAASASPDASAAMSALQSALASFKPQLDKLPKPTKGADQTCGDTTCYTIDYHITSTDLAALASPGASATPGDVTAQLLVRQNDFRLSKVTLGVTSTDQVNLTLAIAATYDQPVTITAPPADQVTEGGGLPFPIPSLNP